MEVVLKQELLKILEEYDIKPEDQVLLSVRLTVLFLKNQSLHSQSIIKELEGKSKIYKEIDYVTREGYTVTEKNPKLIKLDDAIAIIKKI